MIRPSALAAALLLALAPVSAQARSPATPVCSSPGQPVHERGFVRIGGIDQWITIDGERCGNPVILFLHGGPGNPLSPFADTIYGPWARDFTLVQWDQRGAGMTFGRNRPSEDEALSLARMTADGLEVARYLTGRLGAPKVILMGGSWGSALGVHMVQAEPGLFFAYVGSSQLVSSRDNTADTYDRVLGLARGSGDEALVSSLEGMGPPPWSNPRNPGVLRRAVRRFERLSTDPAPADWWTPAPDYATAERLADYEAGEEYSYLAFVGMAGDGMAREVDLNALGTVFATPVFLIQGESDLLTGLEVTRRYFDGLQAPQKALIVVPGAGHDPNPAMVAAQLDVLKRLVLPLIQN